MGKQILGVNTLLVPTFWRFSILVPTFLFHHFQSLNQLTHVILVIFVSQLMEITELTNREIKILLKIYCSTHQGKKKKKHQDLYLSSTRTPKNTNPYFKHKNTCPNLFAFSCPFLSTKHKHKSISSKNTNTNLAADLLRFSQTTKPRYTNS